MHVEMIKDFFEDDRFFQYKFIPSCEITFSQDVANACSANLCGKYGTCWTCPPGVGEWEKLEEKIKKYKNAIVFSCKYELEDSFDIDGMRDGGKESKLLLNEFSDRMKNEGIEHMKLGCGGCDICPECTYPDSPCRFPEKAIPSVEACGIDVVALSSKIGINYNNGPNTVTYFCIIVTDEEV